MLKPRLLISQHKAASNGFTLLEILLVLTLIAAIFSVVKFPTLAKDPFEVVEHEANKVAHLIDLASEYAVLNNAVLGFASNEQQYAFLLFDGERWIEVVEPPFMKATLEQNLLLSIQLDGLEWQNKSLLSDLEWLSEEEREALEEKQAEDEKENEDEERFFFPQVLILPSGEISPFDLDISYSDGFDIDIAFKVRGEFTTPVSVYEPQQIEDLQL